MSSRVVVFLAPFASTRGPLVLLVPTAQLGLEDARGDLRESYGRSFCQHAAATTTHVYGVVETWQTTYPSKDHLQLSSRVVPDARPRRTGGPRGTG